MILFLEFQLDSHKIHVKYEARPRITNEVIEVLFAMQFEVPTPHIKELQGVPLLGVDVPSMTKVNLTL